MRFTEGSTPIRLTEGSTPMRFTEGSAPIRLAEGCTPIQLTDTNPLVGANKLSQISDSVLAQQSRHGLFDGCGSNSRSSQIAGHRLVKNAKSAKTMDLHGEKSAGVMIEFLFRVESQIEQALLFNAGKISGKK